MVTKSHNFRFTKLYRLPKAIDQFQRFKEIEASGNLIESVFYNNRYYGIPAIEVENADKLGSPSVVVVDPIGIKNVQKYSESKGWTCISIFVNNPLNVLMERLEKRYENDCSNINPNDKNAELFRSDFT